mmetsp:Transcript_53864/g.161161  ORF Transcript_53864/g.161161 Transcript_53864/m.161161 type:complete len:139 (+) Transcript_53864:2436-2852(+)
MRMWVSCVALSKDDLHSHPTVGELLERQMTHSSGEAPMREREFDCGFQGNELDTVERKAPQNPLRDVPETRQTLIVVASNVMLGGVGAADYGGAAEKEIVGERALDLHVEDRHTEVEVGALHGEDLYVASLDDCERLA